MAGNQHPSEKHASAASGLAVFASAWHIARNYFADPYRPELHYMRGPGPKWQAKYGHLARATDATA